MPTLEPETLTATTPFDDAIAATQRWFDSPRFHGIVRLYTARQVVEQRGTIAHDYTVAREAAAAFYDRLRELFAQRKSITTFGPYSPGQAVAIKRMGIEGIYLGGWATSAKGSTSEDPGPDLASYPLSQVPDEAASLVRALLTADRNQQFQRAAHDRGAARGDASRRLPAVHHRRRRHRPRRRPARAQPRSAASSRSASPATTSRTSGRAPRSAATRAARCSSPSDEQIKRLNAARFQLDVMGVPGIIVARTDAEAANLIDSRADERDHPFMLGATNLEVPSYKAAYLALLQALLRPRRARAQRPPALRAVGGRVRGGRGVAGAQRCDGRGGRGGGNVPRRARRRAAERQSTCSSTRSSRASSTRGRTRPTSRPSARRWPTRSPSGRARATSWR